MDVKVYSIKINGIQEAIDQAKALSEQLASIEARIEALDKKVININIEAPNAEALASATQTRSTYVRGQRTEITSQLQTEDKLLKEIASTEEKISNARRNEYNDLLAQKDVLKEVTSEAKERAAAERLLLGNYSNTMRGLKEELKDIKTVMQTTDLGSDKFRELTTRANTLTQKLKDIEASYGTFGRNVGNYAQGVAAGMSGLTLQVAGVTREFDNAKQALMALKKERDTLAVKQDQGLVLSEEELQRFRELVQLVPQLQSSIQDAGRPMDALMDNMESFVALASAGKGLSAFFGLDGGKIDKTLRDLMALQTALKGIQTIARQIQEKQGLGKYLGGMLETSNKAIDAFTNKLFGLEKITQKAAQAEMAQASATSAVAVAEKTATAGAAAQTAANVGLTTSMKASKAAADALNFSLKALGIGIALAAVAIALEVIQKAVERIGDAFDTAEKKAERLKVRLDALHSNYAELLTYNNDMYNDKSLSYNDYFLRQVKLINEELEKEIRLRREAEDENIPTQYGQVISAGTEIDLEIEKKVFDNIEQLREEWWKLNEAFNAGEDYYSRWGKGLQDWLKSIITTVGHTEAAVKKTGEAILNDFAGRFKKALNELENAQEDLYFGIDGAAARVDNAKKKIKELHDEVYNTSGRSIIDVLDSIKEENVKNKFQKIIDIVKALRKELHADDEDVKNFWHSISIDMLPPLEKALQQAQDKYDEYKKQYGRTAEEIAKLDKWLANEQARIRKEYSKKNAAANKKELEDARKNQAELNKMRIANMREGLSKIIKEIEEEKRERLEKLTKNSELYVETEKYYDKKIEDAKKKHAEEMKKIEKDMWETIYNMSLTNYQKMAQLAEQESKIGMDYFERMANNYVFNASVGSSTYGIQGKNTYSKRTQKLLFGFDAGEDKKMFEDYKKLIDILREFETEQNNVAIVKANANAKMAEAEKNYKNLQESAEEQLKKLEEEKDFMLTEDYEKTKKIWENELILQGNALNELEKTYDDEVAAAEEAATRKLDAYKKYKDELSAIYSSEEDMAKANAIQQAIIEENYTQSVSNIFKQRMTNVETYWAQRKEKEKGYAEDIFKQQVELEKAEYQKRRRDAYNQAEQLQKQADEAVKNGKMAEEKRNQIVEEAWKEHAKKEELLNKEHNKKLIELEQDKNNKLKSVNAAYYQDALQELTDFQIAISNLESKQPVMNAWGIINLKETKKNNNEIRVAYEDLIKELREKKKKLNEDFKNGLIDRNVYESSLREIDIFSADLGEKLDAIGTNFGDFWQGVDTWLQEIGQAFNSIYSSLATITDNYYQGEIDKQEEYIKKYEDMLDKQREATQKYADSVESIEDELSNARGARRQHLIDQLNAEMAAQRASLAQEKQIEAEKQKAEDKKKDLENEQARKRKKADEIQAYINALMAVSMAMVNTWPIPAIPMVAMATAMGAAQVAAIKSQPTPTYGQGGKIEGEPHSRGGVKALVRGQYPVELEGQEYIIRKTTATKNVELLEYVNKSQRKLSLEDFIEFYSTKAKASVKASSPKAKYAEGGSVIPLLRNDVDLGNRLIEAFEDYAERPSVVQVVDILDGTQRVNNVRVLAGLD